jgi:hypothetical protein
MSETPLEVYLRYLKSTQADPDPAAAETKMETREAAVAAMHAVARFVEACAADESLGYEYAVDFLADLVDAAPAPEPVRQSWPATTIEISVPDRAPIPVKVINLDDPEAVKALTEEEIDALVEAWGAILARWPEVEHPLGAREGGGASV